MVSQASILNAPSFVPLQRIRPAPMLFSEEYDFRARQRSARTLDFFQYQHATFCDFSSCFVKTRLVSFCPVSSSLLVSSIFLENSFNLQRFLIKKLRYNNFTLAFLLYNCHRQTKTRAPITHPITTSAQVKSDLAGKLIHRVMR